MVFCTTKTALKIGRGRAVHFFCVPNVNDEFIFLFLNLNLDIILVNSAPREFAYIWQSEQVAIIARAEVSKKRRSHCLVMFSPPSPSCYLINSRICRSGRLLPPLCIVLLSSIFVFFQNQRSRTQTLSQLSVRSHEKYSVGDGKYSANREELEIIPYQEGLYHFWGWEVVWVIHLLFLKTIKRTRSKSFVTPENIRFRW